MEKARALRGLILVGTVCAAAWGVLQVEVEDAHAAVHNVAIMDYGSSGGCIDASDMRKLMITRQMEDNWAKVTTDEDVSSCGGFDYAGSDYNLWGTVAVTLNTSDDKTLHGQISAVDWSPGNGEHAEGTSVSNRGHCTWKLCTGGDCDDDSLWNGRIQFAASGGSPICHYQATF
jgi:hypothetical protein